MSRTGASAAGGAGRATTITATSVTAGMLLLDIDDSGITERATITANGQYPSRALVVQGRLWSLFDGGVIVSDFANPAQGAFTSLR